MELKLRTFPRPKRERDKKPFEEKKIAIVISGIRQKDYNNAYKAALEAVKPFMD